MNAFAIAIVTIKDPEKFADYGRKAGATMAPFGGQVLHRGKFNASLTCGSTHTSAAVIGFPDSKALADWYASEAYQAIVPLRDQAADVTLVAYDAA